MPSTLRSSIGEDQVTQGKGITQGHRYQEAGLSESA